MAKKNPQILSIYNCFLISQKKQLAPRSYALYRTYLRPFANAHGHKTVDQVTSGMVLDWVAKTYGHQSGSAQWNAARSVARMFRWAYDERLIPEYPLRGFRKPTASRRENFVTPRQYAALLKESARPRVNARGGPKATAQQAMRDVIKFLWHTGARPQELRIICAEWVQGRKIVIPAQFAKGGKKARVIYLDDMAYRIVQRLRARHPAGPIFRTRHGNPWSRTALADAMKRLCRDANIEGLCCYSFRHSFITRMLERGIDVSTVAAMAGNTPATIFKFYEHVSRNDERLLAALG